MESYGIWIDDANEEDARFGIHEYRCSNCGHYATEHVGGTENWWCISKPNFCHNCGIKMDAEKPLSDERQLIINKVADKSTLGEKDMTEQINNDIKVGDEIRTGIEGRNAINSVVHLIGNRGDCLVYQCITAGGHHHTCTSNDDIRKTGRHFPQIAEVLKEMQSETVLGE